MIVSPVSIAKLMPISRERAMGLVAVANTFHAHVSLTQRDVAVNAKSMLGLMALARVQQPDMLLECDGEDENEAMMAVTAYLKL